MKIKELEDGYRKIKFEKDLDNFMTDKAADDIIEIFNTPLTGTYNWDYTVQDNRIKKLYELGKELNWNVTLDVDWSIPYEPITEPIPMFWDEYPPYQKLSDKRKVEFLHHRQAWSVSQYLHC